MLNVRTRLALLTGAVLVLTAPARAADSGLDSLKSGTPELKSVGALAFGQEGILFAADPAQAAIFALDTGDRSKSDSKDRPRVEGIDGKMASLLGIEAKQLLINDLAVNPISGNTYFSVMRGKGPDGKPAILKMDRGGKLSEFGLSGVKFAKAVLPNPTTNDKQRADVITQIAYVKGKVYVAGLSNEEFASNLRSIPFPFGEVDKGTSISIWHAGHGATETKSPVRTFAPLEVKGETYLLAAYTCTPLVRIPVSDLKPGEKVKGTTVAELGQGNRPLDMIVYEKGGKPFVLMSNNKHGLLKIPADGIEKAEGLSKPVKGTDGIKAEKLESFKTNVLQLDQFDKEHALVLLKTDSGLNVETIELP
jgi:hypothetical protein